MKKPEEEASLLEDYVSDSVSDSVDHRGSPAAKSSTGGWRSAWFIIGEESNSGLPLLSSQLSSL